MHAHIHTYVRTTMHNLHYGPVLGNMFAPTMRLVRSEDMYEKESSTF